jgi:membrane protein YdbS with pleckstrin-like domain
LPCSFADSDLTSLGLVAVDKYLLPREVQVATVRKHPAVLIGPSAAALGGLLVAGVLATTILRGNTALLFVLLALELILVLRLIWKAINWAVDYFVVTSQRLLLTTGLFTRKVAMMPLTKVTDMSFQRSFAGRLFGFGEFIVESAGQDQALRNIDHIPYPEQLYLLVCGMIFPVHARLAYARPLLERALAITEARRSARSGLSGGEADR